MRGGPDERDDPATAPRWRTAGLAAGAVLAVAATVVVFLTDDPRLLRLAVVGGAWAFVIALLAAGRRRPAADPAADPDPASRRERETESRLRREADDAMRAELAALRRDVAALGTIRQDVAGLGALRQDVAALGALRQDLASLTALRAEVAALAGLRQDVAALAGVRQDVAALGALRQDVAALAGLRQDVAALGGLREDVSGPGGLREEVARLSSVRTDLGQLGELRAELGRLRTELTEQLSSEMFLERVVMRTQSSRGPAGSVEGPGTRSIEAVSWSDEPPRELTGGWPAVRLETPAPEPARRAPVAPPAAPLAPVTRGYDALQGIRAQQVAEPRTDPALPVAAEAPHRRRRTDDPGTAERLTVERPLAAAPDRSAPAEPVSELDAWPRPPAPLPPEPPAVEPPVPAPLTVQAPGVPTPGEARLAQILAESGTAARTGGRRRHRYRDDDEDDDVLARVLGRH